MSIEDIINGEIWSTYEFVDDDKVVVMHPNNQTTTYTLDEYIKEIEQMKFFTNPEYENISFRKYIASLLTMLLTGSAWGINLLTAPADKITTALLAGGTVVLALRSWENLDTLQDLKCIQNNDDIRIVYGDFMLEEAKMKRNKLKSK